MDENNMLNETYQNARKEHQSTILQLEGNLKETKEIIDALKAENEQLKAEIAEKSSLQSRLKELEEHLLKAKTQLKEEVERNQSVSAAREAEFTSKLEDHANKARDINLLDDQVVQLQKDLQLAQATIAELTQKRDADNMKQEAAIKLSQDEIEAKNKQITLLEDHVKDLEHKLQLADAKITEKGDGSNQSEVKDGLEIKSRDIGLNVSAPSKRKSKKKSEATSAPSSSWEVRTQSAEHSPLMTLKITLTVALVSVIIGVILGKRY
ncbi:uncharacterized protein LOC133030283 [Cannabis sativa]|uniref:Uncharacterized protein n=1 Tax=Cannabis sativa TaxID=3483 RepID=A0A7J6HZL0_CANSA|nr:uncharacterized protein LOC133030283 [Cannabis sativa]KAF4399840.1 hypothetical protein G4B88_021054 [Cannabis sativa]